MAEELYPQYEFHKLKSSLRIGVFICECGGEIAGFLDTNILREKTAVLPGVAYATSEAYPCNKDGRARIRQAITDHKLDRVLIAGCTPRLVEKLFREVAEESGLDGAYLDIADIREQCAYVHRSDPAAALQKAADLISMGIARLTAVAPPRSYSANVIKSVMVIGSGLSGLTVALALAESDISVTLIEKAGELGGTIYVLQGHGQELITERINAVSKHPSINILLNAHITEVTGTPGNYEVSVAQDNQTTVIDVGAIIVATGAQTKNLDSSRWFDRSRVITQTEFADELEVADKVGDVPALHDIVMIFYAEEAGGGQCSRICCMAGIRQAIRVKQLNPNSNVTVLFRDLYLGGAGEMGEDEFLQAKEMGVTFFRYRKDHPPVIDINTVNVDDPLTDQPVRIPFNRVVLAMPLVPQDNADALAAALSLPQDKSGFMIEERIRLRPGCYTGSGIYVVGGAHQPSDTTKALYQAYIAGSRVQHFLSQDSIRMKAPVAEIDQTLCTGCGNCVQACPMSAIKLRKGDGLLSMAEVDVWRCTSCGNCAVVCPVKAISLPEWSDPAILSQITTALTSPRISGDMEGLSPAAPRILAFTCEWSAYAAADMAGVRRIAYPANVRIIRLNCSARLDPNHVLWAFLNGADGVFLGACPPGDCHNGAGNLYAKNRVEVLKNQLAEYGVDPHRLNIKFISGDDGLEFANSIATFTTEVGNLMVGRQIPMIKSQDHMAKARQNPEKRG